MDLNLKHKIINFLEDNRGENLGDLEHGDELFNATSKAQCTKEKLLSWTLLKLKTPAL